MARLVILLACVAALSAVSALECYSCDNETCKKDMKEWTKQPCGSVVGQENVCQKFSYKDKDGKENVSRRCASVTKGATAPCPQMPADGTNPLCPTCTTDLCNSATSVNFSFAVAVGILAVFLGQKYLL